FVSLASAQTSSMREAVYPFSRTTFSVASRSFNLESCFGAIAIPTSWYDNGARRFSSQEHVFDANASAVGRCCQWQSSRTSALGLGCGKAILQDLRAQAQFFCCAL